MSLHQNCQGCTDIIIILTVFDHVSKFTNLQCEGQHHVRLGQGVFILLAHVHNWGVVASFELLQFELPSSGHRHALKVGHQQIDRRSQLFDIHGLHLSWCKPRKPSTMLPKTFILMSNINICQLIVKHLNTVDQRIHMNKKKKQVLNIEYSEISIL